MSLAESIVQILEDAAREQGYVRVRTVWLEIGQLACVEQESLRFCFDLVTRDGIAHRARLEIIEMAGQGRCLECLAEMPMAAPYGVCPVCGSLRQPKFAGNRRRPDAGTGT